MKELVDQIQNLDKESISAHSEVGLFGSKSDERLFKAFGIKSRQDIRDDEFREARMALSEMLKEVKPDEFKARRWGDLERIRFPDNTHRWLCSKHRDEYKF